MKVTLAAKDPGQFQLPPQAQISPVAQKVDTPDTAPAAEETH
jgi:hypothetical protein